MQLNAVSVYIVQTWKERKVRVVRIVQIKFNWTIQWGEWTN